MDLMCSIIFQTELGTYVLASITFDFIMESEMMNCHPENSKFLCKQIPNVMMSNSDSLTNQNQNQRGFQNVLHTGNIDIITTGKIEEKM